MKIFWTISIDHAVGFVSKESKQKKRYTQVRNQTGEKQILVLEDKVPVKMWYIR